MLKSGHHRPLAPTLLQLHVERVLIDVVSEPGVVHPILQYRSLVSCHFVACGVALCSGAAPWSADHCAHAFIQVNGMHKPLRAADDYCSLLIVLKLRCLDSEQTTSRLGFPCQMLLEGFWAATHLPLHNPSSLTPEQRWVSMDCCAS